MKPTFEYQKPKVGNGELRTPVEFYEYEPNDGPEPGEDKKKVLHTTFAEVYNPSMKDLEILNSTNTKEGLTINIRDPKEAYLPSNKHKVEIKDRRYQGKVWEIKEVRHDLSLNAFVTIVLGVTA